jgi:hypothetical protein
MSSIRTAEKPRSAINCSAAANSCERRSDFCLPRLLSIVMELPLYV